MDTVCRSKDNAVEMMGRQRETDAINVGKTGNDEADDVGWKSRAQDVRRKTG